jgi:hypothetical protein
MFCRMCGFPSKNAMSPTVQIPLNHPFARPRKIRFMLKRKKKASIRTRISRESAEIDAWKFECGAGVAGCAIRRRKFYNRRPKFRELIFNRD